MKRYQSKTLLLLLGGLAVALWTTSAQAGPGVVIDSSRLPSTARSALRSAIQKARATRPQAFERVAAAPALAVRVDAAKRGRFGSITPQLKALGKAALLPMLEMVAVDGPARGQMSDGAWLALRVGLIEAVGMLRDRRAAPVLAAILDSPATEVSVDRAAAQALGRLGTDRAAAKLVSLARKTGPKRLAVLAGIGDCRREVVAETLAELMRAHPADATAQVLARSLGKVGNSWAWKTSIVAASGEGPATRAIAAEALMDAFVHYDGRARKLAAKAILVVDHPSTPSLISAARRSASAELSAALDRLAKRFASSPLRR